jgi:drug/metabolite transporter (DMT)-like permease
MNETHRPRQIGRRIGAVLAGAIAGVAVTLGTDRMLQATGFFPPSQPMRDALLLLATAYRAVYGIAGSYLTARLAPYRPTLHVLVLGAIGCALGHCGCCGDLGPGGCRPS